MRRGFEAREYNSHGGRFAAGFATRFGPTGGSVRDGTSFVPSYMRCMHLPEMLMRGLG